MDRIIPNFTEFINEKKVIPVDWDGQGIPPKFAAVSPGKTNALFFATVEMHPDDSAKIILNFPKKKPKGKKELHVYIDGVTGNPFYNFYNSADDALSSIKSRTRINRGSREDASILAGKPKMTH